MSRSCGPPRQDDFNSLMQCVRAPYDVATGATENSTSLVGHAPEEEVVILRREFEQAQASWNAKFEKLAKLLGNHNREVDVLSGMCAVENRNSEHSQTTLGSCKSLQAVEGREMPTDETLNLMIDDIEPDVDAISIEVGRTPSVTRSQADANMNTSNSMQRIHRSISSTLSSTRSIVISTTWSVLFSRQQVRTYRLEENLYDYAASPASSRVTVLILLVFYTVSLLMTSIITYVVYSKYWSNLERITQLCSVSGDAWDCRPEGYETLMDFNRLDTDGNGVWTVAEARGSGLLQQFRGLHDALLVTDAVLLVVAPAKPPVINFYCYAWAISTSTLLHLNDTKQLEMAETSGSVTQAIRDECKSNTTCIRTRICPKGGETLMTMPTSSRAEYLDKTKGLSIFSRGLYNSVKTSLIYPCRLGEPSMCGNAESKDLLRNIPMWATLDPEQRVRKCKEFVQTQCPRVLGSSYTQYQVNLDEACGEKSFTPRLVARPPPVPSKIESLFEKQGNCIDNNTLAKETTRYMYDENPIVPHLMAGLELSMGLPPSSLRNLDCSIAKRISFCNQTTNTVNPTDPSELLRTMSLVGQACPETCCSDMAPSCPTECAVGKHLVKPTLTAPFGTVTCLGSACSNISMQLDNNSGVLMLGLGKYNWRDTAKIIMYSDLALRVQVLRMDIGSDTDALCTDGDLSIDGSRYCSGNKPDVLNLPRRVDGIVEIKWFAETECLGANCGWSLMIMDDGEPSAYSISTVKFEGVTIYEDINGDLYKAFFVLILFVWTVYIMVELQLAWRSLQFTIYCPSFPGSKAKRFKVLFGVCVPRLMLASWVCVVGYILLISAPDFVEIVLNSVALAFILDLDEIMYRMLLSEKTKLQIKNMDVFEWVGKLPMISTRVLVIVMLLIPAVPAVAFVTFQYSWHLGFSEVHEQIACACYLQGDSCTDSWLGE